jgi:hypothetical protein
VSLNDESLELEFSTTTRALQHVNLERAFHEFGPWAIARAGCVWQLARKPRPTFSEYRGSSTDVAG